MMLSLVDESLERYAGSHSTDPGDVLNELAEITEENTPAPGMLSGRVVGNLLQLLVYATGAHRVLEIGTFTGYSALVMARALPPEGELITCDIDEETTATARRYWDRTSAGTKIHLKLGPALQTIQKLEGSFDLIFVDADKENYPAYYEAVFPLLSRRGLMIFDNVLWSGRVLNPEADTDRAIVELNDRVQADTRVQNVLLTVRDGLLLLRKVSD